MNREEVKKYLEWLDRNRPAFEHFAEGGDVERECRPGHWKRADYMYGGLLPNPVEYRPVPKKPRVGALACEYSWKDRPHGIELTDEVKAALEKAGIDYE